MAAWDGLLAAPWRTSPAAALIAIGLFVAMRGLYRERRDLRRPPTDPGLGFALTRTLRSMLGGLALAGIGVGWLAAVPSLMLVSALIGVEELLEISSVIRALRSGLGGERHSPGGRERR
jgi:hypothetical protein